MTGEEGTAKYAKGAKTDAGLAAVAPNQVRMDEKHDFIRYESDRHYLDSSRRVFL